ncbi:endonuclease [Acidovorax sp. GW101-3H11]|uniref:endonuclease/exonuclease/phosphatase family protein n=1 Tax=Acidovorax sp. GW101-3H11 TaxID=1813946 RepID=UPI0007B4F9B7|nr:endonuclease/exonuclease/phosphatase family protein [Acidovorax sp. GW101-3H11]KZT16705.1 endonuclease [Acidovorax sp. GW101-3H11]
MPSRSAIFDFCNTRAQWLVWLCALGALTAPVSRKLSTDNESWLQWLVELAAHWQWAYAVVGAAASAPIVVMALMLRQSASWLPLPASMIAGSLIWQPATLPAAAAPTTANAQVLKVGTANLNLSTTDFTPLRHWLASADAPDVVFLQEFTELAQRALADDPALAARYPHRLTVPQPDPFGLAILSRYPLAGTQVLQPRTDHDTLRLRATMAWNGQPVHLSALHPMPPISSAFAQARDRALQDETQHLTQAGGLSVMAGDLNTTPWARGVWDAEQAQMRRAGLAVPTWPNAWGWLSVLPLDHVLASSAWQLVDAHTGPDLGSDHRPMVVRLVKW